MSREVRFIVLNRQELKALNDFLSRCTSKSKWRTRKRGQAIYFSHNTKTPPQIARELNCSLWSVYSWLKRYREKGLAGISEPAKQSKLTDAQVRHLIEISHHSKIFASGKSKELQERWSFRKMAKWVKDNWGINLSHERIRQIVHNKLREW
jgi:transposase